MTPDKLASLHIPEESKRRSSSLVWGIVAGVLLLTLAVVYLAVPRASDAVRSGLKSARGGSPGPAGPAAADSSGSPARVGGSTGPGAAAAAGAGASTSTPAAPGDRRGEGPAASLTVSGYIVARERIEVSPRFMGVVKWIGVRKGDAVTNDQVVVRLDDAEYQARAAENDGQRAVAEVALERARVDLKRAERLVSERVEMQKLLDDARLAVAAAEAQLQQIRGARRILETWIEWCTIRSPVNGVVLEKLVDPGELVTPQTFGAGRGPSTSLVAVADLTDLQVEIEVNEADLAKVKVGQACRVSPEAYPDRQYDGVVAEVAP
ncbi:MAG: efflux RND transporter periplasmic adaptor subunit, partial [Verrucomicrobiota bacterium]